MQYKQKEYVKCKRCEGKGKIKVILALQGMKEDFKKCPACHGYGYSLKTVKR